MRVLLKGLAFAASTLFWHAAFLIARPFVRNHVALRGRIMRGWGRALLRIFGARIEVSGPLPRGPFLLVSNHLGYFDIPLIASQVDCVFVAKHQVAGWPLLGRICADMGAIFLKRDGALSDLARVNTLISERLASGESVVFFPEGTSSAGAQVEPFHAPLLAVAARLDMPVHYAAISYAAPAAETPAHLSVCWWGGMEFVEHLKVLLKLSGFRAILRFGAEPVREQDRKRLTRQLHEHVSALFTPVVDEATLAVDRAELEAVWTTRAQTTTSRQTSMS
jgi:1-acyl-sn-glycerol-3-phosphate acyltransferase